MNIKYLKAHIALFAAGTMWGLMSPIGKAAMDAGITSLSLTTMRMIGAAVLFWTASLFMPKERVSKNDSILLFFAGMLSIVFNQGLFIFGLSQTSPVDASIITTSLPIITMILATAFLKELLTPKKVVGVIMGAVGALLLILSNNENVNNSGNIWGDTLCVIAQISFACYLTFFRKIISRYNIFTLMKWMFTYATIVFLPFSYHELSIVIHGNFSINTWLEVGYVILFGTFFTYMLVMIGQKTLRSTIVSMYNYVQPIVGACASILIGMGTFSWNKAFASILIFIGVYLVTYSKYSNKKIVN